MLSPDDRSMLLELLEPPEGMVLDAAVGVTYTLNLEALLSIPTAFALTGTLGEEEVRQEVTPIALLDALRTQSSKITVCCDASGIGLPPDARSGVFSFLESCVVPVRAPRGGVFHPKLWIVRYAAPGQEYAHRLVISSRNLTFDRSWDTVVSLEETDSGIELPAVSSLLSELSEVDLRVDEISEANQERLEDLAASMRRARFGLPAGFDAMNLHVLGMSPKRRSSSPLPGAARRALVVSPFLSFKPLEDLPLPWGDLTVVSRPDQLDATLGSLPRDVVEGCVYELTTSAIGDAGAAQDSLSGLHAKIWVFDEAGGRSRAFVGSANATNAAFNANVEVLLELGGRTQRVGVEQWLVGEDSMRDLLIPHRWHEAVDAETDASKALSEIRRSLSRLSLSAVVGEASDGRYRIIFNTDGEIEVPSGVRVRVRPLALRSWTDSNERLEAEFTLDAAALSAFLGVRLELKGEFTEFALVATVTGMPGNRDAKVLAGLLANPERLVRYLLMLLADPSDDRFDGNSQQAIEHARRATHETLSSVPLLEVVARALAREPERLGEIDQLLQELDDGDGVIDADLKALWSSVRAVAGIRGAT